MTQTQTSVRCNKCGNTHSYGIRSSADINPCLECGSTDQQIKIDISGTISVYDKLKLNAFDSKLPSRTQQKRNQTEIITGHEWSVGLKKWVLKERVIDKPNDLYRERIVDPNTGEVIHECEEPLSEHTGHGDAKPAD